ncbi:uncharacterized protein [Anabrus simplex]|uniref:uncharacterized protein isoform X1 n=1 Tax=Anabrus simplex TaxID=316456 RepID=UPI0035A30F04
MVWAVTYLIGCGRAVYKENVDGDIFLMEHFVCNYGPAGNVLTMPVYKRGPPASQCPAGLISPNYSGLCLPISAAHMNTSILKRPPPPPPPPPSPPSYIPSSGGRHKWSTPKPLSNWRTSSQYTRYPDMNYSWITSPSPQHNKWLTTPSTPVEHSHANNIASSSRNQPATEGNNQRVFPHPASQSTLENQFQMNNYSSLNGHKKYDPLRNHAKEDQLTIIIDQSPGEQQDLKVLKLIVGPNAISRTASEGKMIKVSNNVGIIVEPSEKHDKSSSNTQCSGDCGPNKSSDHSQEQNDETSYHDLHKMSDSFDSNSQSNIPPYSPQNYKQKENTGKYKAAYPEFSEIKYPFRSQDTDDQSKLFQAQTEQRFPPSVHYQQLTHPKEGSYGMGYSVS